MACINVDTKIAAPNELEKLAANYNCDIWETIATIFFGIHPCHRNCVFKPTPTIARMCHYCTPYSTQHLKY